MSAGDRRTLAAIEGVLEDLDSDTFDGLASKILAAVRPRRVASMTPVPSKGRPKEIVRLSEETVAALAERAEAEGVTKSDIMRRAIVKELGLHNDE